jgi:ABC-type multidrug transport system fused ATPase/permease subunit
LKQILKDIFKILNRKEIQRLWQLTLADVLISILDIVFLIILLYVINFYTQPAQPVSAKYFSPALFNEHPVLLIGLFLLLFTFKNILGFFISRAQYNYVYNVASRISKDNLLEYLNGPYADYIHVDSSVMNRRISQQPIEFCHYVLNGLQQIFSQFVLILITITAVVIFNPLLLPLLILILVPPVFLISIFIKRRLHEGRLQGQGMSEKSMQHLQEALTGYVESNLNSKNDFFTNRYHRFQSQLNRYLSERLIIQNMPTRFIEVFAVFGLFLLILLNFFTSHQHSIPLISLGALMVAAYKIIPGVVKMTNLAGQVKTYAYTAKGLIKREESSAKTGALPHPISSIGLENIYFDFEGKSILKSFSMKLDKGDMIGISGISGRGKTTLVNILLGFLPADKGNIYFNGHLADAETRRKFWSGISYIKQQHFFLHASVLENITFEENNYNKKKLDEILILTGVDQMIGSFPAGLNTIITENGKNISGGQRQRLILARALYRDFDLLILDEPFGELDKAAEVQLLEQLRILANKGKIILLITHNMDAFSFCNKKIQLDDPEK